MAGLIEIYKKKKKLTTGRKQQKEKERVDNFKGNFAILASY